MSNPPTVLDRADRVVTFLAGAGVDAAVIGAVAMAVHGYPRSTEDLDLAINVDPRRLGALAEGLRAMGFEATVSEPDADDPLGGVVRLLAPGAERIELVNFSNPPAGGFPALAERALKEATALRRDKVTRVVSLPHLLLFKLYAGGPRSKGDLLELLSRNPETDLGELRALCASFRLERRFDAWMRELTEEA